MPTRDISDLAEDMIDTLLGEGVNLDEACDAAMNSLTELLQPVYSRMFNEAIEIQTNCENAATTVVNRIHDLRLANPQLNPGPSQTPDEAEVVRRSRFERDEVV